MTWLSDFTFTFHFDALEKEMATHSGVLAWRIPGTGEPGGLLSMGSHRVGHDWSDLAVAVGYWQKFSFNRWLTKIFQSTQTSLRSHLKWYIVVIFFMFLMLWCFELRTYGLMVFSVFGNLAATVSSNTYLSHPSPLGAPITYIWGQLKLFHNFLILC